MKITKHILSIFAVTMAMTSLSHAVPWRNSWGSGEPATFAKWSAGREFGGNSLSVRGQGGTVAVGASELWSASGDDQSFPELIDHEEDGAGGRSFLMLNGALRGAPPALGKLDAPEPGSMAVNGLIGSLLIHRLSRRDRRRSR